MKRSHPKMSENELNHKERLVLSCLVLSIEARIQQLIFQVQDDGDNMRFKPGRAWWLETLGKSTTTKFPEAVHLCDQIGVSQEVFQKAFVADE
jgi:hypothetical protein